MNIPLFDLTRQHKRHASALQRAYRRVLGRSRFILDEEVTNFEQEFADALGARYAVGVASGTEALALALKASGLKQGDEVIVPANSLPTVFAVTMASLTPRIADVERSSGLLGPEQVQKRLTKKVRAIIAVHLYGNVCDLGALSRLTRSKNLVLIEDCAQAAGALWRTHFVGTVGEIGCFSFYPTKNLGALGDGGAITTNSKSLYEQVRRWRMYGERKRYVSVLAGWQSRLDELQAAFLREKLPHLTQWVARREELLSMYEKGLAHTPLQFLKTPALTTRAPHLAIVLSSKRSALRKYLAQKGIATGIHYPTPIHHQKAFAHLRAEQYSTAEYLSKTTLSLPLYPELTNSEVRYIIQAIRSFV